MLMKSTGERVLTWPSGEWKPGSEAVRSISWSLVAVSVTQRVLMRVYVSVWWGESNHKLVYGGNFLQGDSIRPLYIEAKCTDVTVKIISNSAHTLSHTHTHTHTHTQTHTHRMQSCNTQIQQRGCQSPSAECLSREEFCRRVISTNRRSDTISLLYKYYDA